MFYHVHHVCTILALAWLSFTCLPTSGVFYFRNFKNVAEVVIIHTKDVRAEVRYIINHGSDKTKQVQNVVGSIVIGTWL
jgi:hypothetical protein